MTDSRILYLATDAYGGRGGIALYNRDTIEALLPGREGGGLVVIPRITGNGSDPIPAGVEWRAGAGHSLFAFARESIGAALSNPKPDVIYCAHVNLLGLARLLKRLTGAKLLLAIYGFEAWTPFRRWSARAALGDVDKVLSISAYTANRFSQWSGVPRDSIAIVPNAIRLEEFGLGPKRGDLVDRFGLAGRSTVMLLGRMDHSERMKGFDEIIQAMPALLAARPETKLLLAGDGGDMPRLQQLVQDMGLADDVAFTGFVPEQEKADYYRLADAYVMPSRQEGFGFVHLEAMACGVPSVASIADGAREAVRDGLIGRLIDPEDQESIVRETLAALDDPKLVPEGLGYFAFPQFAARMRACVHSLEI